MLTLLRLLLLQQQILVVVDPLVLLQALYQPLGADACSGGMLDGRPTGLQLSNQQVGDLRIRGVLTGELSYRYLQ